MKSDYGPYKFEITLKNIQIEVICLDYYNLEFQLKFKNRSSYWI